MRDRISKILTKLREAVQQPVYDGTQIAAGIEDFYGDFRNRGIFLCV